MVQWKGTAENARTIAVPYPEASVYKIFSAIANPQPAQTPYTTKLRQSMVITESCSRFIVKYFINSSQKPAKKYD